MSVKRAAKAASSRRGNDMVDETGDGSRKVEWTYGFAGSKSACRRADPCGRRDASEIGSAAAAPIVSCAGGCSLVSGLSFDNQSDGGGIRGPGLDTDSLVVRWTIGDVRKRGFELLHLSIACARRLFGSSARYVVCVNSIEVDDARRRSGYFERGVEWRKVTRADAPEFLSEFCSEDLMEGMGWKLCPLRVDLNCHELILDNDCVLWALPQAMRRWLEEPNSYLFTRDVERRMGSFETLCPPGAMNAGIRGLPPGDDLSEPLMEVLRAATESNGGAQLNGEIEEQGLQAAAICWRAPLYFVETEEVTLCSPFWPRTPELGTCGAHFVGMNAAHIPWNYYDRPADEWLDEHWEASRPLLYEKAEIKRAA